MVCMSKDRRLVQQFVACPSSGILYSHLKQCFQDSNDMEKYNKIFSDSCRIPNCNQYFPKLFPNNFLMEF